MAEQPQHRHGRIHASFESHADAEAAVGYLRGEAIPEELITLSTGGPTPDPQPAVVAQPSTNEALQEDEHRNLRALGTGIAAAGAGMAAAGVVIATGGAALPAVAAAVAAGTGAGIASEGVAAAANPDVKPDSEKAVATITVAPQSADQSVRAAGMLRRSRALKVWEDPV
ncbi:hypothetical protein [Muricoccus radiodurans]|uniref:hypothetical protein n=1 Tax=Muricoccus radiodurans TaxID=2231721 RepID=UPI003CF36CA4